MFVYLSVHHMKVTEQSSAMVMDRQPPAGMNTYAVWPALVTTLIQEPFGDAVVTASVMGEVTTKESDPLGLSVCAP